MLSTANCVVGAPSCTCLSRRRTPFASLEDGTKVTPSMPRKLGVSRGTNCGFAPPTNDTFQVPTLAPSRMAVSITLKFAPDTDVIHSDIRSNLSVATPGGGVCPAPVPMPAGPPSKFVMTLGWETTASAYRPEAVTTVKPCHTRPGCPAPCGTEELSGKASNAVTGGGGLGGGGPGRGEPGCGCGGRPGGG